RRLLVQVAPPLGGCERPVRRRELAACEPEQLVEPAAQVAAVGPHAPVPAGRDDRAPVGRERGAREQVRVAAEGEEERPAANVPQYRASGARGAVPSTVCAELEGV